MGQPFNLTMKQKTMCCGEIFPDDQNVDGVKATNDAAKAKRVISPSVLTQAIERDHSKNH